MDLGDLRRFGWEFFVGFDEKGKKKSLNGRNLKKNDEEWRILERGMVFVAVLGERGGEK